MDKYLLLEFENARLFPKNPRTKDKVYCFNICSDRKNQQTFVEPITVYQISNLIHALLGERPVPSFRDVPYGKIDKYYQMALESWLKIDTATRVTKKGITEYPKELIHIKKSAWNAWSKIPHLHWEKIKQYVNADKKGNTVDIFTDFIILMHKALGYDVSSVPFSELKEKTLTLSSVEFNDAMDLLKKNGKGALYTYLTNKTTGGKPTESDGTDINKHSKSHKTTRTTTSGIDTIYNLHGFIYIPIDDEELDRLSSVSTGTTTLLDGGVVHIKGIINAADISEDDMINFNKVDSISTKKH